MRAAFEERFSFGRRCLPAKCSSWLWNRCT